MAATPHFTQRQKSKGAPSSASSRTGPIGRPLLLAAPAALWIALFTVVPFVLLVAVSFWVSGYYGTRPDFSLSNYARIFQNELYGLQLLKTLRIALVATLIALALAYPVAWYISRQALRMKTLLILVLFIPFWVNYVVRAFVWLPILGRSGAINSALMWLGVIETPIDGLLYSEGAVIVGLVYVYTLFMTLPILLTLERIDENVLDAARDLGATPLQVFFRVVLPLSWPGALAGCVMVFLLTLSAYVTPQLLGGPSGLMFGNLIASQFLGGNNWAFGAALSCVLVAVALAVLAAAGRWIKLHRVLGGAA
jgi:spermidine/putrescine transport system permease protein